MRVQLDQNALHLNNQLTTIWKVTMKAIAFNQK